MTAVTFGSVFAGIGGLDLGLERAGMMCRWQIENDTYCNRVLAKHWPTVKRYEDVCDVSGKDLERVDFICGGFPCQDISNAGKREGIDGAHSGLWSEMCRLVREVRPGYVLVENVAALLGRGMGQVLGDLAACGYDAEWDCLSASQFGAHHIRQRVFVLAYPVCKRQPTGSVLAGRSETNRSQVQNDPTANGQGGQGVGTRVGLSGRPMPDASILGVADGVPHRVDRLRGLGNAVVPQVAEYIGRMIVESAAR